MWQGGGSCSWPGLMGETWCSRGLLGGQGARGTAQGVKEEQAKCFPYSNEKQWKGEVQTGC